MLAIPVAAVVEQSGRFYCWVTTETGTQQREISLGDSDDQFLVVNAGIAEGDQVVLNPLAFVDEAQNEALQPYTGIKSGKNLKDGAEVEGAGQNLSPDMPEFANQSEPPPPSTPQITGTQILNAADKNKDGVLTQDEFSEEERKNFETVDLNHDGRVDESELDTTIKKKLSETK